MGDEDIDGRKVLKRIPENYCKLWSSVLTKVSGLKFKNSITEINNMFLLFDVTCGLLLAETVPHRTLQKNGPVA